MEWLYERNICRPCGVCYAGAKHDRQVDAGTWNNKSQRRLIIAIIQKYFYIFVRINDISKIIERISLSRKHTINFDCRKRWVPCNIYIAERVNVDGFHPNSMFNWKAGRCDWKSQLAIQFRVFKNNVPEHMVPPSGHKESSLPKVAAFSVLLNCF